MLKKFGTDEYRKATRSHAKMIEFMAVIHKAADADKENLIAKGYAQVQIDKLKTLGEQLKKEKAEQMDSMNRRPATTEERIKLHNIVFAKLKELNEAAAILFVLSPAKLKLYELPGPATASEEEEIPVPTPNPSPTPIP